jgi:predicted transposase/invertase (TIGR01784 family)
MVVNGRIINIEIQIEDEGDYIERCMFNWSREFSSALPAGGHYTALPRTIVISILSFNQFACKEFHSEFQPLEVSRHTPMTDKMVFHFFELKKLPKDIGREDKLLLWLSLFKAETEEEMARINEMGVPEMSQAISAYQNIAASSEFRELERMRERAMHDEAQALHHAALVEREKWQVIVSEKDTALAEKDTALAEQTVTLAEKDKLIAELLTRLEKREQGA